MKRKIAWSTVGLCGALIFTSVASARGSDWQSSFELGRRAFADGRYMQAEEEFRSALESAESFGKSDPRLSETLTALAELYEKEGKWTQAEAIYWRCLEAQEAALGPDNQQLSETLSRLAQIYTL
ncbi:MAG: tetratricopeptide repeat protein, partial [Candidatus Obscuribacterales bacterium]|nr:tetratricopeptide repeat protein [Candidatus Obscuribacterales bacterium]